MNNKKKGILFVEYPFTCFFIYHKIKIMIRKILCCMVILYSATATLAQNNVTSMWPYKYSDFRNGTVYFDDQQTLSAQLNVHLLRSTLHYLDDDKIREVNSDDIAYVIIDNIIQGVFISDKYYICNDQLMRVVNGDSTITFVAELVLADFSAIKESGGAYGSSSNVQATRKLSSVPTSGLNVNHMELKSKKDGGSLLPLVKKYFIVVGDAVYPATRKAIESQLPDNRKGAFKQFIKKNKINWKDADSLAKLTEFLIN